MFDYENVPEEMKIAQKRMYEAICRERKARANYVGWKSEYESACKLKAEEEKSYGEVSLRWDPEKQIMSPPLEDAPSPRSQTS